MKTCLEVLERLSKGYIDTDDLDTIRLILKGFDIIKEKEVNVYDFKEYDSKYLYNKHTIEYFQELTPEDYALLKDIL